MPRGELVERKAEIDPSDAERGPVGNGREGPLSGTDPTGDAKATVWA